MWAVQKSGYRGTAAKVRAAVRIRATRLDRTTGEPSHRAVARGRSGRRWSTALVTVVVAAVGSISLLALGGLTALPASAASGAPAVSQCNPPDFPTGAGYQVTCTVSVDNYTSSSGGDDLDGDHQRMPGRCRGRLSLLPAEPGTSRQHHQLVSTRHIGEPVQRHRERCRQQCVLQRHGHQPHPGRNDRVGRHGESVRRVGRQRARRHAPPLAAPQMRLSRNATVRRTAVAPMPESRPRVAP